MKLFTRKEGWKLNQNIILFGKEISVKVQYCKIKNPELDLVNNIVNVYLPYRFKRQKDISIIKLAIDKMYDEIARIEIENIMEETRIKLNGLAPENYQIKRMSNKLAKMTLDKNLIINPEIVKYDKQILRYVVLYEFCRLKYKTNCKSLFMMMEKNMENYEDYNYILNVA